MDLDHLAWLVLWYRSQCESSPTLFLQGKLYIALAIYRLWNWMVFYVEGKSHIQSLCAQACLLKKEKRTDQLGPVLADIQADLAINRPTKSSGAAEPTLEWAVSVRDALDLTCKELLKLSSIKTVWNNDTKYKYVQLYEAVFETPVDQKVSLLPEDAGESDDEQATLLEKSPLQSNKPYQLDAKPAPKPDSKGAIDWVALGFQGSDPSTDFRASGTLGLDFYHDFCTSVPATAREVMIQSGSFAGDVSKPWYSVALVSIHLTQFVMGLLREQISLIRGVLLSFDVDRPPPEQLQTAIMSLHTALMLRFHQKWLDAVTTGYVTSVMDTERFIKEFEQEVLPEVWQGNWSKWVITPIT
jgi:hypothetical protein